MKIQDLSALKPFSEDPYDSGGNVKDSSKGAIVADYISHQMHTAVFGQVGGIYPASQDHNAGLNAVKHTR